jgi:hypothetical protein
VLARGSGLMNIYGIGPAGAARIVADVGDIANSRTATTSPPRAGTAPIHASSGEQIRHRLSRAGNRRLNHVFYMAAFVQLRHDTDGRAYYRRKLAAGKLSCWSTSTSVLAAATRARSGAVPGLGRPRCRGARRPKQTRIKRKKIASGHPACARFVPTADDLAQCGLSCPLRASRAATPPQGSVWKDLSRAGPAA